MPFFNFLIIIFVPDCDKSSFGICTTGAENPWDLINSSKLILISFPLKLVLKFSGKLPVIFGAIVSFAPPVIVPLFAQFTKIFLLIRCNGLIGFDCWQMDIFAADVQNYHLLLSCAMFVFMHWFNTKYTGRYSWRCRFP